MTLLIGTGALAVVGAVYWWRSRRRPGRAHLYAPPHTPPTVPWSASRERRPRGR